MASLPLGVKINHAQPEPKRPVAASLNFCLNPSSEPKSVLICLNRAALGWPALLLGDKLLQKK